MTEERLQHIRDQVYHHTKIAAAIYCGERENYNGADGARYVLALAGYCQELLIVLSEKKRAELPLIQGDGKRIINPTPEELDQ